ncbi:hypothetical protein NMG60_11021178 [Bertholletia excelsa]
MVPPISYMHPPPPPDRDELPDDPYHDFPDPKLMSVEKTKGLVKKESLPQQEKQISVDPISLLPPPVSNKNIFLSTSLPSSATSSPYLIHAMSALKKKGKNQILPSHYPSPLVIDPLSRQHSVALSRLAQLQEIHLRRSKSCGEGRSTCPSYDFDLWSSRVNRLHVDDNEYENKKHTIKRDECLDNNIENMDSCDEKFKCGALCLFLPGFGRGKPVRPPRIKAEKEMYPHNVISKRISLEKFECGSWTSSAIMMDTTEDDGNSNNMFFDLPLELISDSVNDADSPVTSAFVFDKNRKGVLKTNATNNSSRATLTRESHESSRHVRFSTSTPTSPTSCITPRLRKARDDFSAFLEAQGA